MKAKYGIVFVLLLLQGCSWLPIREKDLPPPCQGQICTQVAESGNRWLEGRKPPQGTYFTFANIAMQVPEGFDVQQVTDGQLLVWPNGVGIRFKKLTLDTLEFPSMPNPFESSGYSVVDYPHLMFFHSADGIEPTTMSDRFIWRMAMDNKGLYFASSKHLYYSRWNDLDLYFAGVKLLALRQLVFVTDSKQPNQIIELFFYNTPLSFFLDYLASVRKVTGTPMLAPSR